MEIERKFILKDKDDIQRAMSDSVNAFIIKQGYLCIDDNKEVRVRQINDTNGFITVKSRRTDGSASRFECETEISAFDASCMLKNMLMEGSNVVSKTRYIIPLLSANYEDELKIEVDIYHGKCKGLVTAEIEIPREDYPLEDILPNYIHIENEITGLSEYDNASLSAHGYSELRMFLIDEARKESPANSSDWS